MSSKDDPGRDKARSPDPSQPKKPYATIDLKATEVKPSDTTASAVSTTAASGAGKDSDPSKPSTAAQAAGPSASAWSATSTPGKAGEPAKTDAAAKVEAKPDPKTDPKAAAAASAGVAAAKKPGPAVVGSVPPATEKPVTAAAPKARGGFGSFLTHMAAGIVGGGLVLLGGEQIIQGLGLSGDLIPGQHGTATLQQRLAALETQAKGGGTPADLAQKLVQSEKRIEEQAKTIAQLNEATGALASEAKVLQEKLAQASDAQARVIKLEETLATLSAAAAGEQPGRLPQLMAITTQVKQLEAALATQTAALRRDLTQTVETRAAQVAEAGEVAKSATQRIDRDMAAVKTESARLTQRVEALKADGDRHAEGLRVLQEETGKIASALDALKGDVESRLKSVAKPNDVTAALAPVASKIATLEQSLAGVVKSEEDRRSNAERIVLSLELANLKRVLDRGQGYAAELAELKKAAGGKVDLAVLDRFAVSGVSTQANLLAQFRDVASAILDTDAEPADGNIVGRLLAGAKSVVRVRKVDHKPDDMSAEAIVGRMEKALKEGRMSGVIDEAKSLSPAARQAAAVWLDKVAARDAIDKALVAIEGQLKSSLAGAKAQN